MYVRGWRLYHHRDPDNWPVGRLAAFLGGLAVVYLALASPVEPFASLLLSVHMVQHTLLMMVAPPLIWLSAPLLPLVRGLPEPVRTYWVAPLFRSLWLRGAVSLIAHPVTTLVLFLVVTWTWHTPWLYDGALQSPWWHYLQHACFLVGGLLFWFPVVRPYPFRPSWSVWLLFPYLILADLSNTVLSALLTFSDRVLYPHYASLPPIGGGTALDDQSAAGVLMWVPGSLAYLLPLIGIGIGLLFGETSRGVAGAPAAIRLHGWETRSCLDRRAGSAPLVSAPRSDPRFDLLRVPVIGRFLRWRYARPALQLPMLVIATAVVADGFTGPEVAPMNLAGVLVWVHWRGLLILGLLIGGNFFCTACPFMLPRTLARRWLPVGMNWPCKLRGKWFALGLLVVFFTSYEAFALWDSPRLTAWIVVGYFAAAFLVDGLFRGAAFCKYVCPIGQFNFVQSLASPLEVSVRNPAVCAACETKDCIRGRDDIPGCELELFQPGKQGNMDCTFCLDCVHACPHGNIGILAGPPGRELPDDPPRSGVGRFGQRPDIAALVVVLVFAAFANAAGMVGPVLAWKSEVQRGFGLRSPLPLVIGLYAIALLALPAVLMGAAAWTSRALGGLTLGTPRVAVRFAPSLVPLGFAMWTAHYGFHLATSYDSAWPVTQRFAAELGWTRLGEPEWVCGCCRGTGDWITKAELFVLDLGLLLTLYIAYHTARRVAREGRHLGAFVPWAVLAMILFAAGVWVVLQPMQMRGTMLGAG